MPMWRCPHCGTPQAEAARCWVCRRSSTTCSTCRHFRRSVAAQIGYCGLDRQRLPLAGTEIRGCWEASPMRAADGPAPAAPRPRPLDEDVEAPSPALRLRDFVPVELVRREAATTAADAASARRRASRTGEAAGAARAAGAAGSGADPRPEPATDPPPEGPPVPSWDERVTLFADADL